MVGSGPRLASFLHLRHRAGTWCLFSARSQAWKSPRRRFRQDGWAVSPWDGMGCRWKHGHWQQCHAARRQGAERPSVSGQRRRWEDDGAVPEYVSA